MKPIYEPKARAKEYGNLAINIYTGCPHQCYYCFAPAVLHKSKEVFHGCVEPRKGIVEAVKRQLDKEHITGKLIEMCFVCDPYPRGCDSSATREIIKALKAAGNHVQILTKGDGSRDFDLLDGNDWYGATITCNTQMQKIVEPGAISSLARLKLLEQAKKLGIKTWVSFEPVLDGNAVISCIAGYFDLFDKIKIGKLNYHPSNIDWKSFGQMVESVCKETGVDYYIKDDLRKEMQNE